MESRDAHAGQGGGADEELTGLLGAASVGDEGAWRSIVALYGRRVYALVNSRCRDGNVAEEITQSVFATVALKVGSGEYQELGRFEPWLFRVAMNRVRDHIRRVRRRPDSAELRESIVAPAPAGDAAASDLARLRGAMDQLTEQDREVVELRHHGQMSFKQMAEMLAEPVGTLLARHHRALRKLRELMGERDETGTVPSHAERGRWS